LVIFETRSQGSQAWTAILPFELPHVAGMTEVHHDTQPLVEMESWELFAWAGLEPRSSPFLPPM
jgi:hypothetical protein